MSSKFDAQIQDFNVEFTTYDIYRKTAIGIDSGEQILLKTELNMPQKKFVSKIPFCCSL